MSLELPLHSAELQCKAKRFFAHTLPIPVIGTQTPWRLIGMARSSKDGTSSRGWFWNPGWNFILDQKVLKASAPSGSISSTNLLWYFSYSVAKSSWGRSKAMVLSMSPLKGIFASVGLKWVCCKNYLAAGFSIAAWVRGRALAKGCWCISWHLCACCWETFLLFLTQPRTASLLGCIQKVAYLQQPCGQAPGHTELIFCPKPNLWGAWRPIGWVQALLNLWHQQLGFSSWGLSFVFFLVAKIPLPWLQLEKVNTKS